MADDKQHEYPDRYCNRCGCHYDADEWRCHECRCPEFSLQPNELYAAWCRRRGRMF